MRIQILILGFKGLRKETLFHDPDSFHFTDRLFIIFLTNIVELDFQKRGLLGLHNCNTEAHTTNSAVWPVPYACAQPYHLGSGIHGQLFHPC